MAAWMVVPVLLGIAIGYVWYANRRRLLNHPTDDGNFSRRHDRPDPWRHQRQSCRNRRTQDSNHHHGQSRRGHLEHGGGHHHGQSRRSHLGQGSSSQGNRSQGSSRRDYGRQDHRWRDGQDYGYGSYYPIGNDTNDMPNLRPRFQHSSDNCSTASSMSSFYNCSDDSQTFPMELDATL